MRQKRHTPEPSDKMRQVHHKISLGHHKKEELDKTGISPSAHIRAEESANRESARSRRAAKKQSRRGP